MTLAEQGITFGAFTPVRPGGDQIECVNLLEQSLGTRLSIVNNFRKWGAPSGDFTSTNTRASLLQSSSAGRTPLITWEPRTHDGKIGPYSLQAIIAGEHDPYIVRSAAALRDLDRTIYLRPMHEMNGDWYHWSGDPKVYVEAWRHIHRIFTDCGATKVRFIWCANVSDQPKGNRMESYWPGSEWVDVLGIDGYNCYGGWRTFGAIIRPAYTRVCALDPDMPVWICETATSEPSAFIAGSDGHSKAEWIRDLWTTEGMPRITTLLYFDEDNPDPKSYAWSLTNHYKGRDEMARQLKAAAGWVAPPGPYVPPVPDRVVVVPDGPNAVRVSWRIVNTFTRGYIVYHKDGGSRMVPKPSLTVRLAELPEGPQQFAVASYNLCRTSARSPWVECVVQGEE